ncbi:MAG TPA: PDZ domain-containing protein [Candidatus Aquilonibacter sp.]|nr:PDZ domain-containing protein [Candidatus Aquilonibacter sp.]
MRKYFPLTSVALLPLLWTVCYAAQSWTVDPPATAWGFSSEDSSTGSYLGVDIADIDADRVAALKLKEETGVEVTMVDQDAPAGKAGIKEHDVILSMNGTKVESKAELQRMIHETPPGRVITLGISRDGQPITIKVQLADRRAEFSPWLKDFHIALPGVPNVPAIPDIEVPTFVMVHSSARSGLMVENITPQLGDYFGAKNGNGVLVRSVEKGSRAEKAGLRAGDVIVKVGDQTIHDSSDFSSALRSRTSASIPIAVIRDKKEMILTLTLPPRHESGDVIQESSDDDEIGAATEAQVEAWGDQMAKLEPQMRLAAQAAQKAARAQCQALQDKEKQLRDQAQKLDEEYRPQIQEELQRGMEKLQNEMQKLQREMRDGLDI